MEGEENKLTTFSTWTIMLGCNESNIINPRRACARVTVVVLCVCVSAALAATVSVYTCDQ